jgi:hypothetical protein
VNRATRNLPIGLATGGLLLVSLTTVIGLTAAPTTAAATTATAAKATSPATGLVYPLASFVDWAESPLDNLTNPALGESAAEQEIDNAEAALLQRFPSELDPSALLGPNGPADATAFSEQMVDQLVHLRPEVAGDDITDMANPDFLPDFDHNGTYGDPGDFVAMENTATADTAANAATGAGAGYFLYPCIADSGAVTYETTTGSCTAAGTKGDTFKVGLAQRETIVNSRGLTLQATLWLPQEALKAGCPTATPNPAPCEAPQGLAPLASLDNGRGLPTVVIADGIASDQDSYFWLAMALARSGDIVLTYDPAGQGGSAGSVVNLFTGTVPNCEFSGACRDLQDVMRWLVDDPITAVSGAAPGSPPPGNPAYAPKGDNQVDPALADIDQSKLGIAGHSMGALSLLNYLWFQGHGGQGADGHPLPPIAAGVALSGAAVTTATVPIQFQTSDYDGSPTLVGPAVAGVDLGAAGTGIGYQDMEPLYNNLRRAGPGTSPLSMIVLEGGVHTDFIDTPFITRTPWSLAVSSHYATDWFGCFLGGVGSDCLNAVVPVPHLSSSFASEAAPDNGPLPHASYCIVSPTTASLNDPPSELPSALSGHPTSSCLKQ